MKTKKESEKKLEKMLFDEMKALGGKAVKLSAQHDAGIPDRMCLFPGGVIAFVEVKSTGDKPRRKQRLAHSRMRRMGFIVSVIDTSEKLRNFLREPLNEIL